MNGITQVRRFPITSRVGRSASQTGSLFACLLILLSGCSLAGRWAPVNTSASPSAELPAANRSEPPVAVPGKLPEEATATPYAAEETIQLTYRTDSGRLNDSAADKGPAQKPIPAFTTGTLEIQYPHPQGIKGYARVTATFDSQTDDNDNASLWGLIKGDDSESKITRPRFHEVWTADIRDWQLASLIADLKKRDFFRRVKVVGSESRIHVEINGSATTKDFPPIAELDRLLITIRQEGRPANPPEGLALP